MVCFLFKIFMPIFLFSQAISFLPFSPSPILHVPTTPSLLPFCDFWHYFSSLCFYLLGDLLQSHLGFWSLVFWMYLFPSRILHKITALKKAPTIGWCSLRLCGNLSDRIQGGKKKRIKSTDSELCGKNTPPFSNVLFLSPELPIPKKKSEVAP